MERDTPAPQNRAERRRVVFVENHDSFSWNVINVLPVAREHIEVVSSPLRDFRSLLNRADLLVIGPGPTDPLRAGLVDLVVEAAARELPMLGVCLGHQAIGLAFGAHLRRCVPAHGKVDNAHFATSRWFDAVEGRYQVMRYHSLALDRIKSPLRVIAQLDDGTCMGIEHERLPIAGLQFHPDSYATPHGALMIETFFRETM